VTYNKRKIISVVIGFEYTGYHVQQNI